ncbi:hypothetical protein ACP4OV_010056 [Aristida adscensionis]
MEVAVGGANWLLGKVLGKLSNDLVAGYLASWELGPNLDKIKIDLNFTLGLLHNAQGWDLGDNTGLQRLLDELSKKADEAEDALDELHYFIIQDFLEGTHEAAPDLGDGLGAQALHARHAARNAAGNWFSCFPCCRSQDDDTAVVTDDNTGKTESDNHTDDGHVEKLHFNRVAMSNKIKKLVEDIHSLCDHVSKLLQTHPGSGLQPTMPVFTKRSVTSSEITQRKLFGRDVIFEKTINEMTSPAHKGEILSVLPIVGPGGIGKTTFTQHLYNDSRVQEYFSVTVWICVSTNFDVLKLTKEILSCLPAVENEGNNVGNETTNLDLLQKSIAQRLKSKRFLVVLDDIWECSGSDEWVKLVAPFRKAETNGNMVLVTTRFPKIVEMVKGTTNPIDLHGLEPDEFWKFFQVCVFGDIQVDHDKGDLVDIAKEIANKLKCSPLAAKTVGRLLSKKPSREHWMEILEKKEWLKQKHDDDIIPALKISYDYLPFHLKKCFSYCALFPEDHRFDTVEISRFWISVGIIDSSGQNDKFEDIGSKYLDELLDSGFLIKEDDDCYVMHDLMHELSQSVSSKECAYISSTSFRADDITSSICHLSIYMQDNCTDNFEEEMDKLKRRVNIGNLCSLMIFGEYRRVRLVNILKETFKEIKGLRVLFIFMNSHNSLPHNFSKLVHLRYLKIKSPYYSEVCVPSTLSRMYHLKFLDLKDWDTGRIYLPKGINGLVNLCHFVAGENFHSIVPEVGKMKCLQELKGFHVKKESVGFELRELGQLEELGGELNIYGLEKVRTREEASEAKLRAKRNLVKLGLSWAKEQQFTGDDILDSLEPHSNLTELLIVNHGGAMGPNWLCSNNHMKNLGTLHLEGLSWATLPPIGQMYNLRKLKLRGIVGICQFGPDFFSGVTEKSFTQLKEVQFVDMPELVEWIGGTDPLLFSRVEIIRCDNCPKLVALPPLSGSSTQDNTIWFPNLHHLYINKCPKLCLPPLPHTSMLSYISTEYLYYDGTALRIKMPGELALQNLREVQELQINDASCISFTDLQKLHHLRSLKVERCDQTFVSELDGGVVLHSVQSLRLMGFTLTRKSLSDLFRCFPALSRLDLSASDEDHEEVVLEFPPSSSLRVVEFSMCKNLILPVEDGGGFQGLQLLESVFIANCGSKLFSRWSMGEAASQSIKPFPHCLKELTLGEEQSTMSMAMLSNLTSLTSLSLMDCKNFSVDGFNPLVTFNLETLMVYNSREDETEPYSVAADLLKEVSRIKTMPAAGSLCQLKMLEVDSISAVLVAPICDRLSATLVALCFDCDWRAERFTEEQEQALQLLTSLEYLDFVGCRALQSLPQGLHPLSSLRYLRINGSNKIRSLPNKGLPDSLQWIYVDNCCAELHEECQKLRRTRPDIEVIACLRRDGD